MSSVFRAGPYVLSKWIFRTSVIILIIQGGHLLV